MNEDFCYKQTAINTENPDLCGRILKEYMKFECYAELAQHLKNPDLCKRITHKLEYNIGKNFSQFQRINVIGGIHLELKI